MTKDMLDQAREFVWLSAKSTKASKPLYFAKVADIQAEIEKSAKAAFGPNKLSVSALGDYIKVLKESITVLNYRKELIAEAGCKFKRSYEGLSGAEQTELRKVFCNELCAQVDKGNDKECVYSFEFCKYGQEKKCAELYVCNQLNNSREKE